MGSRQKIFHFLLIVWLTVQYWGYLTQSLADFDLWGYLSFGRLWWEGRGFPYQDVFSYLPTKKLWVYHEWGTGVVLYPLHKHLEAAGLQGLKYALGFMTMAWIYLTARCRGAHFGAVVLALFLIADPLAAGFPPLRAQAFTYFFFALFLLILENYRQTGQNLRLGTLVPLLWVWANLHGGFVAGLGLLGLYLLGEGLARRPVKPLLVVLILSLAATLVNPYGFDYWRYLVEALSMPRPFIGEWHSVVGAWRQGLYVPNIFFFLALAGATVLVFLSVRPGIAEGLVLGVTAGLGFLQVRHTVFFLICFAAYLPGYWTRIGSAWGERHPGLWSGRRRSWILAGLFLVLAADTIHFLHKYRFWEDSFALQTPSRREAGNAGYYYPRGAVEFLEAAGIKGNLLPRFEWGEHLTWRLHPRVRVGMDGRYETVYPPEICRDYFNFIFGRPGWAEFLSRHPHDLILIDPEAPVAAALMNLSGWKVIYRDEDSLLLAGDG